MQCKIVESPEEYAKRSKDLKTKIEQKKEDRQVLHDSIRQRKFQIENNENAQEIVKELDEKILIDANKTHKQIKYFNVTLMLLHFCNFFIY